MLTKMCTLGAKELEISTNTVAEIRNATDQELETFQKRYWVLDQLPPYQEEVWESFCKILNNLRSYWLSPSQYECDKSKTLRICKQVLDHKGETEGWISRIEIVAADVPLLEVTYTYSYEYEVPEVGDDEFEDMFSSPQYSTRTGYADHTVQYQYPQDFWKLLCAVQKYFEDKLGVLLVDSMSPSRSERSQLQYSIKLVGMENSLKEKICAVQKYLEDKLGGVSHIDIDVDSMSPIIKLMGMENSLKKKKCENSLKLFQFFRKHESYIAQFRDCVAAYDKKNVFEQIEAFQTSSHRVLDVDGQVFFEFEHDCGFDLDQKLSEIQKIQAKLSSSVDPGEKNVEYALKWFLNDRKDAYVVSIKKDCESSYRYHCIWLKKPDFIDEPQEYDHILVCSAGIVLIESKYWKGLVKILPDGQLIRQTEEAAPYGDADTVTQMHRHKVLMEKIAPKIPIYNILCLSHSSVIIEGGEFCSDFAIINVSQLDRYLSGLCTKKMFDKQQIDHIAAVINSYKFSLANEP